MARKKNTTNKVVPVVVLAALLAGGYYWLTSDANDAGLSFPSESTSDTIMHKSLDSVEEENIVGQDSILSELSKSEELNKKDSEGRAISPKHQSAKNAYVDEYGNVIYTQPNGVSPIKYKSAMMGRWGYAVKYPAFLTKVNHSSDGSTFEDGKGCKLATYASWNVFNESITDLYRKDFPDVKSVTYKKLFKKQQTYVKSGYTKDNRIYYLKESIFEKDDQEIIATLIFYYPKSFSNQADKVVKEVFGTFPQKK